MKSHRWSTVGTLVLAAVVSHCTSTPDTGDETHFWCSSDTQCRPLGEDFVCRKNECQPSSTASGNEADAGDTGGSSGNSGGQTASGGGSSGGAGGASSGGGSGGTSSGGTSSGGTSSGGTSSGGTSSGTGGVVAGTGGVSATGGAASFPLNLPDPSPGPTVDCNTTWPADTARFDTTAGLVGTFDGGAFGLGPIGIQLNRNGTAVVALFPTHKIGSGDQAPVHGQLMRWAGDTVSKLGQPSTEGFVPLSVDCPATTIVGRTYHPTDAIRWKSGTGFETLPAAPAGSVTAGGKYEVSGVSPDGASAFGTYAISGSPMVVVRWQGAAAAEPVFTLPDASASATAFSRDGSTFLGQTDTGQVLLRPLAGALVTPSVPAVERAAALSGDGGIVAGLFPSDNTDTDAVRAFVWSASGGLETLPDYTVITAITPNRIAVGYLTGHQPTGDLDLVWDPNHGVRLLRDIMAAHGVTVPADVTIFTTHAISDDGRVIVSICTDATDPNTMHLCRAILPANAFD